MRTVRRGPMARMGAIACGAIVTATVLAAGTAPEVARAAPAAHDVVLISQPARSICVGGALTVGVWYQRLSGGSRAYRIAIRGPRQVRFFYRHGRAPSSGWRRWKVRAGRAGEYRTVYSGHRPGSAAWTRYRAVTRAHRCRGAGS